MTTCFKCGFPVSILSDTNCPKCGEKVSKQSKGQRVDEADYILREALEKIEKLDVQLYCSDGFYRISLKEFPRIVVEEEKVN
jgi:transcription initiation factor IIE alpha subunit